MGRSIDEAVGYRRKCSEADSCKGREEERHPFEINSVGTIRMGRGLLFHKIIALLIA